MIVVFTREAEVDLEAIGDFIAQDNPQRALSFVEELAEKCRTLADRPKRFALVTRHADRNVRKFSFKSYLVFYRVRGDRVDILHVLHGARDYEAILSSEL